MYRTREDYKNSRYFYRNHLRWSIAILESVLIVLLCCLVLFGFFMITRPASYYYTTDNLGYIYGVKGFDTLSEAQQVAIAKTALQQQNNVKPSAHR